MGTIVVFVFASTQKEYTNALILIMTQTTLNNTDKISLCIAYKEIYHWPTLIQKHN